jgi:TrmH family RNA methyltransferase
LPPSNRNWFSPAGIGHPSVRQFVNIKKNRTARPDGALVLEGLWAIRAALAAGVAIEVVFVCPELVRGDAAASLVDELRAAGVIALQVSGRVLGRIVERDGPDGLAAIGSRRPAELSDVAIGPATRVLVADRIEQVGNLGTIVRAADGAGASAVLAVGCHFRLSHPLVIKASMGTVLSMPVVAVEQDEALAWLLQHRFRLVVAVPTAERSYRNVDYGDRGHRGRQRT